MRSIIIPQDDILYYFNIAEEKWAHMEVDDIYAIAVYYTGHITYNLDFNPKYEKKIILTD